MMDMVRDSEPLQVADRCDRCGAQAYVRVTLITGELLFCGHDYRENEKALDRVALTVRDEREKLQARPALVTDHT